MTSDEYNESVQAHNRKWKGGKLAAKHEVGFLVGADRDAWDDFVDAFQGGLELLGWLDKIHINPVYAGGKRQKYKDTAEELEHSEIIVTAGTEPAKAAIQVIQAEGWNIPLVVASAADTGPTGTVKVTGFLNGQVDYARDRFKEFRKAVTPDDRLKNMGILANIDAKNAKDEQDEVWAAATLVDPVRICIKDGEDGETIKAKIGHAVTEQGVKSLYVCTDPLITLNRKPINVAAHRYKLPTMYQFRDHVVQNGGYGLMSYGPNFDQMFRDAAALVVLYLSQNQLLPIRTVSPSQLELVWNRKTAEDYLEPPLSLPDHFKGVIID